MSSNSSSSSSSDLNLSPHEFSRIITNPDFIPQLSEVFDDPNPHNLLRYYSFISLTIDQLERELERSRIEQEVVFNGLFEYPRVRTRLQPIIRQSRHQRQVRHRFHPYGRTPSPPRTPSDDNSVSPPSNTPSSVPILPEEALARIPSPEIPSPDSGSPRSYHTAIDDLPGSKSNPILVGDEEESGSKQRPIEIADDDEDLCEGCEGEHQFKDCTREYKFDQELKKFIPISEGESLFAPRYIPDPERIKEDEDDDQSVCPRCHQVGHEHDDCDTPMRTFETCPVCQWTKQEICDHYDVTPAWTKRVQTNLDKREEQIQRRLEAMKETPDGKE